MVLKCSELCLFVCFERFVPGDVLLVTTQKSVRRQQLYADALNGMHGDISFLPESSCGLEKPFT